MRALLAALICAVAWPAYADRPLDDDPAHWLGRMLEAAKLVSYHGEVVHMHGRKVQSMEITFRGDADGSVERLLMLDGPPREVIRDGKSVTCIVPDGRESLAGQRIPRNPFPGKGWQHDGNLEEHYELLDLGHDRVAGRHCKVIGIRPKDSLRYGYRLWIDTETGLLLKSDLMDEDGQVIEQVAFTRIDLPQMITPEQVSPTLTGDNLQWMVGGRDNGLEQVAWTVHHAPAGFRAKRPRQRDRGVVQQVFTDGLATVSVFVEPFAASRETLQGASRMGAISAFGTVVDGWQVTVVGEVPPAAVKLIGESLAFDSKGR